MMRGMASSRLLLRALLVACALSGLCAQRAWAATAAGTSITNFMTVNYQDASSTNYSTISNTVTTLVSNAPSLAITAPAGQSVTIGMIAVDTFTLTNTGNGSGNFQIAADATFAGTTSGTTLNGYVLSSGPCAVTTPCSLATLETQMAALGASGVNATLSVGVEYTVSGNTSNVSIGQTVQSTLTANILYPLAGGVAQAISSNATSTSTDTAVADARLDLQETATQPSSGGATITWTVTANNGGGFAANDSLAVGGSSVGVNGVFISVLLPTFLGGSVLQSTPTCVLSGASSGATATLYYSTGSGWSTTVPSPLSNTVWVGCLIHGGAGASELPSAPTGSNGAGNVTTPQATLTYVTSQPSGAGSTTLNAVTSVANACMAGQAWATASKPALCPTIPLGTADAGGVALATQQANTTPSLGTIAPGGASNTAGSQAYVAPTNSTNTGTAVYVGSDSATQGLWHAASTPWTPYVYGSDGYTVLGGTSANPAYATVTLGGPYSSHTWAALGTTVDARAPYGSSTSASQVAAQDWCSLNCYPYGASPYTIDVNITDGNSHQFSLYLLQWTASVVQDAVLVTDVTHGTNLLFHIFANFSNGFNPMYARWNISGHVRFTIYYPAGNGSSSTFSAYFFDPVTRSAVTSSNSASFVMADTLTQGTWTPGSGGDGYYLKPGSSAPSYASVIWYGATVIGTVWNASTTDVRAELTGRGVTTRAASAWYSPMFGVQLLTTGAAHTVDAYFLDWDTTTRTQIVYMSDPVTGAIFSVYPLSGFNNGTHLVWTVQGNVLLSMVETDGLAINAVLGGLFFGNRVPSDALVNTVSPTGNQPPGTNLAYTTTFTNIGVMASLNNFIVNPVPANTYFNVGSATSSIATTGLTVAITYSNNGGGSYAYTPVSGGGGAPAGYDRNVTNVKWTFTGALSQGAGANAGSVAMTVMIQ
jgi:hypothetical protein